MATKKLMVYALWIIQMYEIPRAKSPIQNCLSYLFRDQEGIKFAKIAPENAIIYAGFRGFRIFTGTRKTFSKQKNRDFKPFFLLEFLC